MGFLFLSMFMPMGVPMGLSFGLVIIKGNTKISSVKTSVAKELSLVTLGL